MRKFHVNIDPKVIFFEIGSFKVFQKEKSFNFLIFWTIRNIQLKLGTQDTWTKKNIWVNNIKCLN